jgi:hypothetical protein
MKLFALLKQVFTQRKTAIAAHLAAKQAAPAMHTRNGGNKVDTHTTCPLGQCSGSAACADTACPGYPTGIKLQHMQQASVQLRKPGHIPPRAIPLPAPAVARFGDKQRNQKGQA